MNAKSAIYVFSLILVLTISGCSTGKETVPAPEPGVPETGYVPIEEVSVEGGTFKMGDFGNGENPDGKPQHNVTLSSFYMGVYEISQEIFENVTGMNPSLHKGKGSPVTHVTWYEAVHFCNRLSERNGYEKVYTIIDRNVSADFGKNGYRLPTEAEWEYAARSRGRIDRPWSGTANEDKLQDYAWYYWDDEQAHPLGQKLPNELGIHDMTGNVEEWCWDWYGPYTKSEKIDPKGPESGTYRVARGGAWNWDADYSRTVRRDGFTPEKRYEIMGFRIARTAF
ncbi:MAG: formylglycine-generating enzyme family protein [Candidatus Neomarinimicrobiota bacterium]|jgi:formylglycine-generating enzyme required for sulfatase activity|nr:formylglycine-generating enzyme family protein [Candidatus Neomarinimicrobiota bacterium]MDX9780342.1 formylglycine-generating enzyme family protein [bacterium]